MEDKRVFQIFDEMNVADAQNKTGHLAISTHFHASRKVKAGCIIEMGASEEVLHQIMNDEVMVLLVSINRKEYDKFKKCSENPG